MNLYKLKYFIITAEELNISKAAERLFISQQALSSQIKQLEDYYGVKLFNRTPSLSLTYAGLCLQKKARLIVNLENEIEAEMDSISCQKKGTLRIGISYARGNLFASQILPLYHKLYPGIELKLVEGNSSELCNYLENKMVDLIIDFAPVLVKEVTIVSLKTEKIFVVIPDEIKKLHWSNNALNMDTLFNSPMLLLPKGNYLRNILENFFFKKNIAPNIVLESKNIDTLISLCKQNMGITFCSEMYASSLKDITALSIIPLTDDFAYGQLVIAYLSSHLSSAIIKGFIKVTTDFLSAQDNNV